MGKEKHQISITLNHKEIPITRKKIKLSELSFYLDNPRVYSIVHRDGDSSEPAQEEIQEALSGMEHVKQLIQAIKQNGGLTDPLLVRGEDKVVLEGNSRLAAYRVLARTDPVRWAFAKCDVVEVPINDMEVKTLLTHYHIVGRKSWDPFEQAGLFWRWHKEGFTRDEILRRVEEMGVSSKKIRHWIEVYSLMVDSHDTNPSKWSYYDEFVKSRDIKKARAENPSFTKIVVEKIKSGEIKKAVEVRDKVVKIAKAGGKTLKAFMKKKGSLEGCYERAVARGATDAVYNRLRKFRENILDPDVKREIKSMKEQVRKKCEFELQRIQCAVENLLKRI